MDHHLTGYSHTWRAMEDVMEHNRPNLSHVKHGISGSEPVGRDLGAHTLICPFNTALYSRIFSA